MDDEELRQVEAQMEKQRLEASYIDTKSLRELNIGLAHSSQQAIRDQSLDKLEKILVEQNQWFKKEEESEKTEKQDKNHLPEHTKNIRRLWEGLFFLLWLADKSLY